MTPDEEEELQIVVNGEYNTPLLGPDGPSSISHNQQQTRILMLGGTLWTASIVILGVSAFVTSNGNENKALHAHLQLGDALLQTVGAMAVAASDIDIDLFAKRHPVCVLMFTISWVVIYQGASALASPIIAINQIFWIVAVPFAYLFLRFKPVLQMRNDDYPRFSDLFAYSLALDPISDSVFNFLYRDAYLENVWALHGRGAANLDSFIYLLSGAFILGLYMYLRSRHSRHLALSTTLYAYLLTYTGEWAPSADSVDSVLDPYIVWTCSDLFVPLSPLGTHPPGFTSLSHNLINHYSYAERVRLIDWTYPIIHIAFPLAYFVFRRCILQCLGHHWLKQRSANADSIAKEQSIAPEHGNLSEVEQALGNVKRARFARSGSTHSTASTDLNAHIELDHNAADAFTLLTVSCFNGHEEAVDLLLKQDDVQVNKGSLRQNWTPIFVAAKRGHRGIVEKLLMHGADVHAKTEDNQNALLAATTYGIISLYTLLHTHHALTLISPYTRYTLTIHSPYTHYTLTIQGTHRSHSSSWKQAHGRGQCIWEWMQHSTIHSLYTHYRSVYMGVDAALYYTLTIHSLYTHYTLTIHSLYTHYTLTIHSLYTHYRSVYMGVDAAAAAEGLGRASIVVALRSYESHFQGHIREMCGCICVASWPGIYSKCWDNLVAQGKESKLSAAVVFLPQDTLHYGKCGSDKCYCVEMYGEKKDWGCKVSVAV
jgi:hypothetical protein